MAAQTDTSTAFVDPAPKPWRNKVYLLKDTDGKMFGMGTNDTCASAAHANCFPAGQAMHMIVFYEATEASFWEHASPDCAVCEKPLSVKAPKTGNAA